MLRNSLFSDLGIKYALARTLPIPITEGTYEYDRAFEHFIVTQIAHLSSYKFPDWRLSYLRTAAGAEIDLVIERPGAPEVLIEVKSTQRVVARDVRSTARFAKDFANPLALCISRDATRMRFEDVLCVHWRDAFKELGLT